MEDDYEEKDKLREMLFEYYSSSEEEDSSEDINDIEEGNIDDDFGDGDYNEGFEIEECSQEESKAFNSMREHNNAGGENNV